MTYPYVSPEQQRLYREKGWWTDETLAHWVDRRAAEHPGREVAADGRRRLTYGDLKRLSEQVATGLCRLGLQPGDVIGIQMPNWVEIAIITVAASRAGLVFTQVGPDLREREVRFMLGFSRAKAVLIPAAFKGHDYAAMYERVRPGLPDLRHVLTVGGSESAGTVAFSDLEQTPADHALLAERIPSSGDTMMRILFTSGTTGDPKAATHTFNSTLSVPPVNDHILLSGPDPVMMVLLPMGLNWGFLTFVETIYTGARMVLVDKFDAERILSLIQQERVTHFCTAPTGLINLLNAPDLGKYDLSSLRLIVSGGASCPVEVIRQVLTTFPGRFLELYGMLETGYHTYTRPWQDPVALAGSVGPCVDGMGLRILDDEAHDVAVGEVGEIAAQGPTVFPAYLNNPDANKRSFTPDGWFLTGDLARMDRDGNVHIVDRKKEMIIRGGANIYPREIEEVLYADPRIVKAAVVGIPDPRLGERTCACLVTRDGRPMSLEDVTGILEGKIAKYKWPERVEMFTDLPQTPTGKIQKFALRHLVVQRSPS